MLSPLGGTLSIGMPHDCQKCCNMMLLLGLFIDRVKKWLKERLPRVSGSATQCSAVQLVAYPVRLLLYADDLTLLAASGGPPLRWTFKPFALQDLSAVNSLC